MSERHLILMDLAAMQVIGRTLIREIEKSLWKHAEFDRLYPERKETASAA